MTRYDFASEWPVSERERAKVLALAAMVGRERTRDLMVFATGREEFKRVPPAMRQAALDLMLKAACNG